MVKRSSRPSSRPPKTDAATAAPSLVAAETSEITALGARGPAVLRRAHTAVLLVRNDLVIQGAGRRSPIHVLHLSIMKLNGWLVRLEIHILSIGALFIIIYYIYILYIYISIYIYRQSPGRSPEHQRS